ncbi:hypothetical protein [Candidatus Manganitrophus noduliformans]|uniref:Carboxypeptidase regulatory-like domain-containing protein n=1 Tax=Candidatus Manganitrophus noduliformans TaxID=2606439 RepID=A0A7X6DPF9_9BACT|nr:hypothetical protein [Candidatus Manganitrophus noduliformans]NKE70940.1 hypothetical protein [Candidatus Manganitrophus noduliformans]
MKRLAFFLFLMVSISGCGGGGRDNDDVTIILRGILTQGTTQGGQGNPATSGEVAITELNKSDTVESSSLGAYSISGVPVGGNYTVRVTDTNSPTVNVTCEISIPDSTTLTVTSQSGGTCVAGSANIGELALNITIE